MALSASDDPKPKALSAKEFQDGLRRLGINAPQFAAVFGVGHSSVTTYARDGVPAQSAAFIRECLADTAKVKASAVRAMTAKEFRAAFAASGMSEKGLAAVLGVTKSVPKKWMDNGVKWQSAEQVRDVLSRPKDFPEAARGYKQSQRIDAKTFRSLVVGKTNGEVASLLGEGATAEMVRSWKSKGVRDRYTARVRAVFWNDRRRVEPLCRIEGSLLRVLMDQYGVTVSDLAARTSRKPGTVQRWLREGVSEHVAPLVLAHVRSEDAPRIRPHRYQSSSARNLHKEYISGRQVLEVIKTAGLNQGQAAAVMGVGPMTVSRWVRDDAPLVWVQRMAECDHEDLAAGARELLGDESARRLRS